MKTSELIGAALDWAVATAEGKTWAVWRFKEQNDDGELRYGSDWSLAGPIIERECIGIRESHNQWIAESWADNSGMAKNPKQRFRHNYFISGPTPLVAAMRAYVASELGLEVEIPDELKE